MRQIRHSRFHGALLIAAVGALVGLTVAPGAAHAAPATPLVSAPLASVVEGDAGDVTMHFVLSLDRVLTSPVTLDVETQDGSATSPDDYDALGPRTVTFPPGTTVQVVDVTVHGDTIDEGDYEWFDLALTNPTGADFGGGNTTANVQGRILDDDKTVPATPVVSAPIATVAEGDAGDVTMHFVLSLDRVLMTAVTVDVATVDGSATAPDDYDSLPSMTVTFAPGTTVQVVDVTVHGDTLDESNYEWFELVLTNPTGADFGDGTTTTTVEGRILDDDKTLPASPILSAPIGTVVEGDAGDVTMHFVLSLDRVVTTAVTVGVETEDGSATSPDDYDAVAPRTVTFAAGTTVQVVDVTVHGDTIPSPDYAWFYLILTNPTGADFGGGSTTANVEGRILDDDAGEVLPPPEVSVGPASVIEGGDGETSQLHFTVALDRPATSSITVDVQSFDNSASAEAGDYDPVPLTTLTFAPGQQHKDVLVTVHGDTLDEGDSELMYLQLSDPVGATLGFLNYLGYYGYAFGTIYDDDITQVALPDVSVGPASVVEGDDGDTPQLHFTVALDRPATSTITVNVQSFDDGASAQAGDYDAVPLTTLTFAPGDQHKDVAVTVHGDTIDEGDSELMYLQLSDPVGATIGFVNYLGYYGYAFGTIYDDDVTGIPQPEVSVGPASVVEGDDGDTPQLHFTVALDRPATSTITVNVQSFDSSASAEGGDYDGIPLTTLTFAPGEQHKDVLVTVHGDTLVEGDSEAMYIQLSDPVGATLGFLNYYGYYGYAFGTIYDDDAPGPGQLRFSSSFYPVGESDGSVAIEVDRVGGSTGAVSVHYSMASGSATDGQDFTGASGTLDWPAGDSTSRTITVPILSDVSLEGSEDFTVTLDDPAGEATLGVPSTTTVVISDDEIDHPPFADAGPPASGVEGSPIQLDATATDTENPSPAIVWIATPGPGTDPGASCSFTPAGAADPEVTCTDDGAYLLTIIVFDGVNPTESDTTSLTVANADPTVEVSAPAPAQSFDLGVSVAVSATIDDPGSNDSHTCTIDWGDGLVAPGTVAGGDCTGSHAYAIGGAHTITVTATDDDGGSDSDTVDISIADTTNAPPVVDAGVAPEGSGEGDSVSLSGTATDTEPITTLWTASPGPDVDPIAVCFFGDATAPSTSVRCTDDGSWTLTLTATDGTNLPVNGSLTVVLANRDPRVDLVAPAQDATFIVGAGVDISAIVSDPGTNDSHVCSIAWGDGTTAPGTMFAGTCTGAHAYATAGPRTITVTATDDDGGSGIDSVDVRIDEVSVPPPTVSIDDQAHSEGDAGDTTPFTFTVSLDHAPAATVTVHWATHDGSATVGDGDYVANSGDLTFTPGGPLSQTVTISVKGDAHVEPDESFTVDLTAPVNATIGDGQGAGDITNDDENHAPVLGSIADVFMQVGDTRVVPISATDPDGDPLTFDSARLPAFAVLHDNLDGTGYLTITAGPGDAGSYPDLEISVSDGSASDSQTFTIVVNAEPNHRPYAVDDHGATHGTGSVTIPVLRNDSDIDDDLIAVTSFDDRGGRVHCSASDCTYTSPDNATFTDEFTYTISDGHGGTARATVFVRVFENGAPTAAADTAEAHGSAAQPIEILHNDRDPEGDQLTPSLVAPFATGGHVTCSSVCAYTRDPGFTGTDTFGYKIDDGHGGTATASVTVTVVENLAPVAVDDVGEAHGTGDTRIDVTANDRDPEGDALGASLVSDPAYGSAQCAGNSCLYLPPEVGPRGAGVFPFTDSFAYRIDDGHGGTATATVVVTVRANLSPSARDDAMTAPGVLAGYSAVGIVVPLPNDSDADGDPLLIESWTQPAHGHVECYPPEPGFPWRCVYAADAGYTGPDAFTYTIYDSHGAPLDTDNGRATATVSVTVTADSAPVAGDDAVVQHGVPTESLSLLVNDRDPDDDLIAITDHTDPAIGAVECGASDCRYVPPAGYAGPYPLETSFSYTVGDGRGLFDTGDVRVTLLANQPPHAEPDRGTVQFGHPAQIDVTANDTDPEGDRLTVTLGTPPAEGVAVCAGTGCTYRAAQGSHGDVSFTYVVSDGNGGSDTQTVTVSVLDNRPPVAFDDEAHVSTRNSVEFDPIQNDRDPDNDPVYLDDWTQPSQGTVVCEVGCRYTPHDDAIGTDTFVYTISDGRGGHATGTVTIHISTNGPPVAADDTAETVDTRTASLSVLGNDIDPDGDDLRIVSHTGGSIGTITCTMTACSYTLHSDYDGTFPVTDTFSYVVTDGKTGSDEASVEITIQTNRPPVANPDEVHAHAGVMQAVNPVLNDVDPDGDPLTLVSVSSDHLGCTLLGCVYTPPPAPAGGYPFTDDIDYEISDGHGHTATGTVHVEVVANTDPTAVDDFVQARTGRLVLFSVLGNDQDVDFDPLTIVASTRPRHGTLACPSSDFRQAPSCTYVSEAGYVGDDTFTYTISDGLGGATSTAMVTVTVVPLNTPVQPVDDTVTIYRAVTTDIDVTSNDHDAEGDPLRIVSWSPTPDGTSAPVGPTANGGFVSCSTVPGSGVCRYTPPPGNTTFPLVDTFFYRVTDGFGVVAEAKVTVTLDNRPPTAAPDHATAHGVTPIPIDVLGNDADPDGDPIVALAVDVTGTAGTAECAVETGICQYTPADGFLGQDVFHYTITDSRGASATTTVTVDVVANGAPDAVDDVYNLGGTLAPSFINVRSNDTDPESDPFTVVVTGPVATAHGTVECDAQGCIYTRSPGPAASDSFDYTIDDGHGGRDTATVHIGLDQVLLVIGLRSAPNPSSHGQPVTFTATVSAPGLGLPTGAVTFLDDGTPIGTVPLTNGTARLTIDTLAAGSHPIIASFSGSGALAGSGGSSAVLVQVVTIDATTTTLTSDNDPSAVGATVTFTATVAPVGPTAGTPGGIVTFLDGMTVLGTGTLDAGIATLATSSLAPGVHDITARYEGEPAFTGSTSAVVQQHVGTLTANDDEATVAEDADPTRIDVLGNDTDPDGADTLRIISVADPDHGTATIDDAGTPDDFTDDTVLYQPDGDYSGTDQFTYTIGDGGQEASATVAILVTPVDDPPVAVGQTVSPDVPAGATRTITLTSTDVDGPNLTFTIVDQPAVGSLGPVETPSCSPVGNGVSCTATVDYTAASASDSFTFRVDDGSLASNIATVDVPVTAEPNPAPEPNPGSYPSPAGSEGAAIALHGTIVDTPPSDVLTQTWSYALGAGTDAGMTCAFSDVHALDTTITCTDDGTVSLTLTADDGVNPPVPASVGLVMANAIPTVDITLPADGATIDLGTSLALSAAVGDAGANDSLACTIDWGDGTPTSDGTIVAGLCTAAHTYLAAGPRIITVTGADDDAASAMDRVAIEVNGPPANPAPEPNPGSYPSPAGSEGAATALHGTVSNEPPSDALTQTWSYALGAGTDAGMTCAFTDVHALDTTITCSDDGSVTVTLTADDGVNPPVAASVDLVIVNADPTVDITSPADGARTGAGVTLSAAFNDAGSNDSQTCAIAWGDGGSSVGVVLASRCTGSHTYTGRGPRTITVTITDDDSGSASDSIAVVVNRPPVVDAGRDRTVAEGAAVGLDGTVSDPDADPLTISWSSSPLAGVDAGAACTFGGANPVDRTVSCTDDGSYTLTLTASDGIDTTSDTMTLTVTNKVPVLTVLTPLANQRFAPLASVALHATIDDPGTNDTHTCSIDWGDGTTSTGVVTASPVSGQSFCDASHAFAGDLVTFTVRSFTIKVTATDDDGASDAKNVTITVDPCTWTGTAGNDVHDGTSGDDVLCGLGGNDTLNGLGGNDILVGQAGNDTLNGGAGNDRFVGGAGTDTASFAGGPAVSASLATHTAAGWGSDSIDSDVENLTGSSNADTLTGDGAANVIDGTSGDDTIDGRAGNDSLIGGLGSDTVTFSDAPAAVAVNLLTGAATGWGNDSLTTIENAIGSEGNDTLIGNNLANRLAGAGGDDTIDGRGGNDDLIGGPGDGDTVTYAASPSAVVVDLLGQATGWGTDDLTTVENVIGSAGDDTLIGTNGPNLLQGIGGDDILNGRAGADDLRGGPGIDRAQYAGAPGPVTANLTSGVSSGSWGPDTFNSIEDLYGSANDDTLTGNGGVNRIWGVGGDDSIDGRAGADELRGGDGRDVITGGTGDDLLLGEDDSDLLNGGDGNDVMYGGLGSDILLGGDGSDLMAGDVGNDPESTIGDPDHMNGGAGDDLMYGQGGDDCSNTLSGHAACPRANKIPISATLSTDYYAQMEGGGGIDRLHGGSGDDRLDGGPEGGNQLVGGVGGQDFCSFGPKDKDLRAASCELPSKGNDKIAWDKWAWKN